MKHVKEKFFLYRIVVKKDADVFAKVYDCYADKIYRFIFFKIHSREETEDLTAEVFLKAWQYLTGMDGREVERIDAFLFRLARNLVIDFYRARKPSAVLDEAILVEDEASNRLISQIDARQDLKLVGKALAGLKEEYQEALILRYMEELEIGAISQILNKTNGATRVLISRAAQALREACQNELYAKN